MGTSEVKDRLLSAYEFAFEAGALTLEHFGRPGLDVEFKADRSPVTEVDRAAEELLCRRIRAAFPADGILGEEFGETPGSGPWRWILDPIDGTRTFIRGVPLYGTLIGIERDGEPVIGVIHLPAVGETVYAGLGVGAWWVRGSGDPLPARVSARGTLADALLCTTSIPGEGPAREVFEELRSRTRLTRTWGDCYGYALVATGRAEIMIDPRLQVWDAAALRPVLVEAGGTFTDWNGNATIHGGNGIATNGMLSEDVLAVTRGRSA